MELRDVVEQVVGLDDEQRAITNEINRALDGFERAVAPAERSGIARDQLSALRERLAHGLSEISTLERLGAALRDHVMAEARLEAEKLVLLVRDGSGPVPDRVTLLADRLGESIDRARIAWEHLGRLKQLVLRRGDVEASLRRVREGFAPDPEASELLGIVLAAHEAAADKRSHDARAFLLAAEAAAYEDPQLAAVVAAAHAVRDAAGSASEGPAARELVQRVVEVSFRLGQERDDLRRLLARVARDVEHRQELSHGLFQASTKASDVLDAAARLAARPGEHPLEDGDFAALQAACLEHGIISLLLSLRGVRVQRADLDRSVADLSARLGDLLPLVAARRDHVERLGATWEELAAVDARTIETESEAAYADVMGVTKEGGVLSVSRESLNALASPLDRDTRLRRLLERLDAKAERIAQLAERLERVDVVLTEIAGHGGAAGAAAEAVMASLAGFVAATLGATGDYHGRLRALLLDPAEGFARLGQRLAPFAAVAALPADAPPEARRAAQVATLGAVRTLFTRLESQPIELGEAAAGWRAAEGQARTETVEAQRALAAVLARSKRLRSLLFPPLPATCAQALDLARSLRDAPATGAPARGQRDQLGEALEALHQEATFHGHLDLPLSDARLLGSLSRERNRRLLDLHGASIVLLFRLLDLVAEENETLAGDERPAHLAWTEDLLGHALREMRDHAARLDDVLFELPDNATRLDRYRRVFEAYHRWARRASETDLGLELSARRGPQLFSELEEPLGRLGERVLASVERGAADWRAASALESLLELYALVLAEVADRPTVTDVRGRLDALRARAAVLRDGLLQRAETTADPFAAAGGFPLG